ncbi:MAG TPA: SIS domain-containing protein [Stellaceae bacterium]|nr:SIS domain-containing protein [Stellaceae bacterium]
MTAIPRPHATAMAREAAESGAAVARQIRRTAVQFEVLGQRLRAVRPRVVITCARGSSDHAACYGKYLIETRLGIPVASIGPSVASLYGTALAVRGALFVAVSQSGRSPDLLRMAKAARAGGAYVVCLVNVETSPLAQIADLFIPLSAGPETSVAATKSHLAAAFAFLQLVAHWQESDTLKAVAASTPAVLDAASALDWGPMLSTLAAARDLYVIGRGLGSGAALEIALKLKETCRLHAEPFSAAEVVHGPLELVGPGFPVIVVTQNDQTAPASIDVIRRLIEMGASVLSTDPSVPGTLALPVLDDLPPELAPLAAVQSFYMAVPTLAIERGRDPDAPANLLKITETL